MNEHDIQIQVASILTHASATTIPVDLFRIADSENIEIYETEFEENDISGSIMKNDQAHHSEILRSAQNDVQNVQNGIPNIQNDIPNVILSAAQRNEGSQWLLFVKKKDNPYKKRFTIAHELGHYYLHLKYSLYDESFVDRDGEEFSRTHIDQLSPEDKLQEIEANHFALNLLMPTQAIRDIWTNLRSIDKLSEIFEVSTHTIIVRLQSLHLLDL